MNNFCTMPGCHMLLVQVVITIAFWRASWSVSGILERCGYSSSGFTSHEGPSHHSSESRSFWAVKPREAQSAGFCVEQTYCYLVFGSQVMIVETRWAIRGFHLDGCLWTHAKTVLLSDQQKIPAGLLISWSWMLDMSWANNTAANISSLSTLRVLMGALLSWRLPGVRFGFLFHQLVNIYRGNFLIALNQILDINKACATFKT